ncbi:hypothetical protein PSAB6_170110 [Paraburkholderia sabiae]|nr:hypothetical protein PSAB6_170110 [Paraburkholderia sabiae]
MSSFGVERFRVEHGFARRALCDTPAPMIAASGVPVARNIGEEHRLLPVSSYVRDGFFLASATRSTPCR